MPDTKKLDKGMTPEEVAEYLNCSAYTVKEMSRRGELPHYRVGKLYRYRKTALEHWVEKQESYVNIKS